MYLGSAVTVESAPAPTVPGKLADRFFTAAVERIAARLPLRLDRVGGAPFWVSR